MSWPWRWTPKMLSMLELADQVLAMRGSPILPARVVSFVEFGGRLARRLEDRIRQGHTDGAHLVRPRCSAMAGRVLARQANARPSTRIVVYKEEVNRAL